MIYGFYLSAAGMQSQSHRLDVIANNMANVDTTGFKRDVAIFQARRPEAETAPRGLQFRNPILDRLGGGTFVAPSVTQFTEGQLETTSRDLDVYLKGPGFLAVRDVDGQTRYTRDGRLTVNDSGFLTLQDGRRNSWKVNRQLQYLLQIVTPGDPVFVERDFNSLPIKSDDVDNIREACY